MKQLALLLARKAQAHSRFMLALLVLSGALVGASVSQQFSMPPPAGVAVMGCVYNASPPTLTTGNPGFVQCSSTGGLVTSGGGGGGGAVTMAPGAVSAGAYQTGAFAVPVFLSGAYASGSIASGAYASGAFATGAFAAGSGVNGWDANAGATTDARCASAATACTMNSRLADMEGLLNSPLPAGTATIGTTGQLPYPVGAIPYTATATGTTAATTATLAGAGSVTTYLCGFSIRANATAAATGNATVTGVITATMNFTQWTAPNASGLGITEMVFAPCIPASGTNQSVAVVSAAPGTGGVVSVTAWGYKL